MPAVLHQGGTRWQSSYTRGALGAWSKQEGVLLRASWATLRSFFTWAFRARQGQTGAPGLGPAWGLGARLRAVTNPRMCDSNVLQCAGSTPGERTPVRTVGCAAFDVTAVRAVKLVVLPRRSTVTRSTHTARRHDTAGALLSERDGIHREGRGEARGKRGGERGEGRREGGEREEGRRAS